ncbi:MAG: hypothetical protein ACOC2C_07785, partial [Cyclonatronaceae bacterium]
MMALKLCLFLWICAGTISTATQANAQQLRGEPYARQFLNGQDYEGSDLSYAITEASDGSILFGNDQVGIQMLNGSNSQALPLPGNAVASTFVRDAKGRLYTGSYDLIARLERGPGQEYRVQRLGDLLPESYRPLPFIHDSAPVGDTGLLFISLKAGFFYDVSADSLFRIAPEGDFVATARVGETTYLTDTEAGLFTLGPNGRLQPVETPFPPGFSRVMDQNGQLLVYLPTHELWRLHDGKTWEKTGSFPFFEEKAENYILSINTLRSRNLVFTSLGGVHIYTPEGRLLEHYNRDNLLPTNVSGEAYEDTQGRLWISSPAGLTVIERNEAMRQLSGRGEPEADISAVAPLNSALVTGTTSGLGVLEPGKQFRWLRE